MFESWRGVVGDIKPTHRPGSLEEFIKLLPDGIGVIPLTVGISSGTEQEFYDVLTDYKQKAAQLAELGVDLIAIGGAPPMMVHGFKGEDQIVKNLEAKHGIPVSTSGRATAAPASGSELPAAGASSPRWCRWPASSSISR